LTQICERSIGIKTGRSSSNLLVPAINLQTLRSLK